MASDLSAWDYVVFALTLVMSTLIGLYAWRTGGKQSTIEEYMLASRQMSYIPIAFSLMASFMSAVTLLGVSSENYLYGTQFVVINFSYILGTGVVCYVYLPVFYGLQKISVYEYLERRFGVVARVLASLAFSAQMFLYMGIVLYAPSVAISAVTGLDKVVAILSVGLVCTLYSTIGGMKAVLLTDVFQSILMFVSVYCVIITGIVDLGFSNIFRIADEGGRIEFFNFSIDPTERQAVFTQIIGGIFFFLSLYAVNQSQVQRQLSARSLTEARKSLWWSLPILIFLSFSTAFAGLTVYAKYKDCDPLLTKRICSADQLLPRFMVDSVPVEGITGLFIAGLLSGTLSTVSSSINSLAAVAWEDYIKPLYFLWKGEPEPRIATLVNKLLVFIFGLACVGMAFVAQNLSGVLQASLTIFGVVGGPILGLFTLGMIFPFTSQKAVCPSLLIALAIGLWMGFGGPKPPLRRLPGGTSCPAGNVTDVMSCGSSSPAPVKPDDEYLYVYRISFQWYTLIGFTITVILGLLLSLIFPQEGEVDESLLSPVLLRIMGRKKLTKNLQTDQKEQLESGIRTRYNSTSANNVGNGNVSIGGANLGRNSSVKSDLPSEDKMVDEGVRALK